MGGGSPEQEPESSENEKGPESEENEERIKFDPEHRPGMPRGAMFKGANSFTERGRLWDEAKLEHDKPGSNPGAVERYEEYVNWMNSSYGVLADSLKAAREALEAAGLTEANEEGRVLAEEARRKYFDEHRIEPPEFMKEKKDSK